MSTGPGYVTDRILATLQTWLPGRLAAIRTADALTTAQLPDPVLWCRQERPIDSVNETPAVMIGMLRMTKFDRLEISQQAINANPVVTLAPAGGALYEATYACRVTVVVQADQWDATSMLRDRYMTAVRFAILGHMGLGATDTVAIGTTMREAYYVAPDPTRWRTYREGGLEFEVQAIEAETIPGIGYVDGSKIGIITEIVAINGPII